MGTIAYCICCLNFSKLSYFDSIIENDCHEASLYLNSGRPEIVQQDNNALQRSTNDTAALNTEATLLYDQIDAIVAGATFNGVALLAAAGKTHAIGVTDGGGTVTLAARVDAVLFRDTVVTYSPQDVKSFGSAFGSLGANKFTFSSLFKTTLYSLKVRSSIAAPFKDIDPIML